MLYSLTEISISMKQVKKTSTAAKKTKKRPVKPVKHIKVQQKPGKIGSFIHQTKVRLDKMKKWQRACIYLFIGLCTALILHVIVEKSWTEVENPQYGVSFSVKYAQELGVDWQDNFTALLDDMQIRNYRLMSYWDMIEAQRGVFNFTELDWQMDEAAKRGAQVSLAIGMRQPRWPECHKPKWYSQLSQAERDQALFDFNKAVVNRYKTHPALQSYQMENEAVNSWFGECTPEDLDQVRLTKEFEAIKQLDPDHPVYMSLSDQHGLPLNTPVPDQYGYSVYRIVWNDKTGPFKFYVTYPTPVWYHRLRAIWIETFKKREIFVHELQIEPWGPAATVDLPLDEQNRSMSEKQIKENISFARKIGKPTIYTWGGEWWYWRKTTFNDPSIWNIVKKEFNRP